MKMKKILLPLITIALGLSLSSCNNNMNELPAEYIKVNPKVLEVHGGKVDATITGTFPEKYFVKKAMLSVTPVLKYEGGEARGTTVMYQGEKVKNENYKVVNYKEGGTFTQNISFDYVPEMRNSELFLELTVSTKKKEQKLPLVKIADGVIATPTLVDIYGIQAVFGADKFERIIKESQEADLMFLIQQSNLRSSELKKEEVIAITNTMKDVQAAENKEISSLSVSAYASPDGPENLNVKLAEGREKASVNFLNKELKKNKETASVNAKFTSEDWDGFRQLVMASNIQDKEVILRVLSMYSDPAEREKEIKNMSSAYKVLADEILPQLRRSKLQLIVDVIGKSDEEILSLLDSDPKSLSVEEIIYAGAISKDNEVKAKAYQAAIDNYPEDWRGYNNLGALKFNAKDLQAASDLFMQAYGKQSTPEANFNLGLVELVKGNMDKAEEYFGRAAGIGDKLNEAMGVLYVIQGKYKDAVNTIGAVKSNNAGLIFILAGDYNSARAALNTTEAPNALTHYLIAIIGARTADKDLVISNLKKAVDMDNSYASLAAGDLEFAQYFLDEDFKVIAKK